MNDAGIKLAKDKSEFYSNIDIDLIFSSDLKRAKQTAKIIFPQHKVHSTKMLREINFGNFDGKNRWQIREKNKFFNDVLNNIQHPLHLYTPFPKGESAIEAFVRFLEFLISIDRKYSSKKIALFTHCDLLETLFEVNNLIIPKIDFVSKIEFDFDSKQMIFSNFKY